MKMSFKKTIPILAICFCTLFIALSCSSDDQDDLNSPENLILGKWELTHIGNGDNLTPFPSGLEGYEEYLQDSLVRVYDAVDDRFYDEKYWFEDSILFRRSVFIAAVEQDTIISTLPYKFNFFDKDSLQLDFQYPANITTTKYKRID